MKLYSALVKDKNRLVEIKNQEYATKRNNGYKVNPKKVKESSLFEYIITKTNMYPRDWDLKNNTL